MTSTLNLLDNYTIREDSNGDYELEHGTLGVIYRFDDSEDVLNILSELGTLQVSDLVDSASTNTVYDSSLEQVGDGNQDADLNSLVSSLKILDLVDSNTSNLIYDSSTETLGDGNQDADLNSLSAVSGTVTNSPSNANDIAIKQYVDSVAQGLNWQESVIDELNDPPGSPTTGDRYLIDDTPTGDWSANANEIAEWNGSSWDFFAPDEGWAVFIEDIDLLKVYQAGDWVAFGSAIDHGNLSGLSDDDHTQYLLVDGTRAMTGALDTPAIDNQDYTESVETSSGVSGTQTVDLSLSNWHEFEADGDITIQFSNVSSTPPGNSVILYFEDTDTTGPHTITWPASVVWADGNVRDTIEVDDDLEMTVAQHGGQVEAAGGLVKCRLEVSDRAC